MENFKLASQLKLRFQTNKGLLSSEQLWDLTLSELDDLAVKFENEYKESGKKSFLVKRTNQEVVSKLKFDITLDILQTKVDESEAESKRLENKAHNAKILSLIAEKQNEELKTKSISDLKKLLK